MNTKSYSLSALLTVCCTCAGPGQNAWDLSLRLPALIPFVCIHKLTEMMKTYKAIWLYLLWTVYPQVIITMRDEHTHRAFCSTESCYIVRAAGRSFQPHLGSFFLPWKLSELKYLCSQNTKLEGGYHVLSASQTVLFNSYSWPSHQLYYKIGVFAVVVIASDRVESAWWLCISQSRRCVLNCEIGFCSCKRGQIQPVRPAQFHKKQDRAEGLNRLGRIRHSYPVNDGVNRGTKAGGGNCFSTTPSTIRNSQSHCQPSGAGLCHLAHFKG